MKKEFIKDDVAAKAIADRYEASEGMLAAAEKQLPESLAAGTGVVIGAKRATPLEAVGIAGPFEFFFITYMAGFVEGENGWSVVRWYDVGWEDMPQLVADMNRVEKELLPLAVGSESATKKMEEYRKFGGNPS
jgi:hypothetical protein